MSLRRPHHHCAPLAIVALLSLLLASIAGCSDDDNLVVAPTTPTSTATSTTSAPPTASPSPTVAPAATHTEPPPPTSTPVLSTFERVQVQVFDISCSSESCHSTVGRAGNLVLQEGHSWDALVEVAPANVFAPRYGRDMLVMPGEPERSFLLAKLTNSLAAGEGAAMPNHAAPLAADTIEIIRAWILAGAPASGVVPGDDGRRLDGGGETPGEIYLPPPVRGVQLAATSPPVPLGSEETGCHYLEMPSAVDFDVNRIQIAVSGGSHHIHLYRPYDAGLDLPDGYEVCNTAVDFDTWELVAATQLRRSDWELPEGVAFHFRAGEQLLMQTHFVNVGSLETMGEGKVLMNLNEAEPGTVSAYAGSIFGQDRDVFVPALSNRTLSAECVFPNPITLLAQTGHYHFRGRRFSTHLWSQGVRGDLIYEHVGYEDPTFLVYDPGSAPTFAAGEGLEWECYWENPTFADYEFGPFTDINEHCNLFAFYYPAGSRNEAITCVKENGVSTTTLRRAE